MFFFSQRRRVCTCVCVRVVCLRGVCGITTSASMSKRAKTNEQEAGDGDHDNGTGETSSQLMFPVFCDMYLTYSMSEAEQNKNEKNILLHQSHYPSCFLCHLTAPAAKKGKKVKEPEAPILYSDPPDKMNSKDGRAANMKITSWNVDGLRAWVKKKGLDVSLGTTESKAALRLGIEL